MNEPMLYVIILPVFVIAGTLVAAGARNYWIRFCAATVASVSALVVGYTLSSGVLLNNIIDMCDDETSAYFEEHGAHHPNCEIWKQADG